MMIANTPVAMPRPDACRFVHDVQLSSVNCAYAHDDATRNVKPTTSVNTLAMSFVVSARARVWLVAHH